MTDAASSTLGARADPPARGRCRCGYDLRGIASRVCPECGRVIEFHLTLSQFAIDRILKPVRWPAKLAFRAMLVLVIVEATVLLPQVLGLFLWLCAYSVIMYRYWRRTRHLYKMRRKYRIDLKPVRAENLVVWR